MINFIKRVYIYYTYTDTDIVKICLLMQRWFPIGHPKT